MENRDTGLNQMAAEIADCVSRASMATLVSTAMMVMLMMTMLMMRMRMLMSHETAQAA